MLKLLKIKPLDDLEDILEEEIKSCERPTESPFNGAILFYFSCFIVTMVFDTQAAIASIAVLALADSLSTLVGYYFGKHKLFVNKKKSWEGSISFFMASLLVLLFFYNPVKAIAVSFFVTFVEMLPHLNDNVSVPLSTAFLLTLIS